jgi:hypothetical protein
MEAFLRKLCESAIGKERTKLPLLTVKGRHETTRFPDLAFFGVWVAFASNLNGLIIILGSDVLGEPDPIPFV